MNFKKLFALLGFLALTSLFIVSCEESDDDPINGTVMISSISPDVASVGETITIIGSGFGTANDPGTVIFADNVQAEGLVGDSDSDYISWTDTKIEVKVPEGAKSGQVLVRNGSINSNSFNIDIVSSLESPTNLGATSINANTVHLVWDASSDESDSKFSSYKLEVSSTGMTTMDYNVSANQKPFEVTDLTEGSAYTFTLYTLDSDGYMSATPAVVTWSPASRFDASPNDPSEPIKVYETSSSFGSGLVLFDSSVEGSVSKNISSSSEWNLALRTTSGLIFGSASSVGYTFSSGTPNSAEIGTVIQANGLNNVFYDTPMDQDSYSTKSVDLSDYNGSIIMNVRVSQGGQFHYARVMVEKEATDWLTGSSPNRYITVQVSYQKAAGVPFAKTAKK